jgi:hypothetical protein
MTSAMNHPAADTQRKLEAWLDGVPTAPPPEPAALLPGAVDAPTAELVFALLVWEAGVPRAASSARRLAEAFVDLNELRVALIEEIEQAVGLEDTHATERAELIATTLRQVFDREDIVSIDRIARAGASEMRPFLEDIPGLPVFVIDRVMLMVMGEQRVPVDDRLCHALADKGIISEQTPDTDAADLLSRICPTDGARGLSMRLESAASRCGRP